MNKKAMKSKTRGWKIVLQLMLLSLLGVVLYQNIQPVDLDLLFWQVHIPLVFLLVGMTLMGALITFITVWRIGR